MNQNGSKGYVNEIYIKINIFNDYVIFRFELVSIAGPRFEY